MATDKFLRDKGHREFREWIASADANELKCFLMGRIVLVSNELDRLSYVLMDIVNQIEMLGGDEDSLKKMMGKQMSRNADIAIMRSRKRANAG